MKKTVTSGSLRALVAVLAGLLAVAAIAAAVAALQPGHSTLFGASSLAAMAVILGLVAVLAAWITRGLTQVLPAPAAAAQSDDISQAKALYESEAISASVLASVPQAIIATDANGLIRLFSPGAETMLGYAADEVIGKHTPLLFHEAEELLGSRSEILSGEGGAATTLEADFGAIVARAMRSDRHNDQEWTYVRRDGSRLTVLLTINPLRDAQGEVEGFLGVATDITERTLTAAKFMRMAHYDHLTRLPNRRLLHDRMQLAIKQARREQAKLAVMLIDLDKFKPVNDEHGHSVGDLLLKEVARRTQACWRASAATNSSSSCRESLRRRMP
ncbi:MAG: diguanylate cyclase [Propionivibrio sp.]